MTVKVQEIRIASIQGLDVPNGTEEGSRLTITATLTVRNVDQEWIDVTVMAGKPEQLPGQTTLECTTSDCVVNRATKNASGASFVQRGAS